MEKAWRSTIFLLGMHCLMLLAHNLKFHLVRSIHCCSPPLSIIMLSLSTTAWKEKRPGRISLKLLALVAVGANFAEAGRLRVSRVYSFVLESVRFLSMHLLTHLLSYFHRPSPTTLHLHCPSHSPTRAVVILLATATSLPPVILPASV